MRHSRYGFMLIELLISLVIIAIVGTITIQGLHYLKQQTTNDVVSSKIIKTLQFAKQQSLLRHMNTAVCFADNTNQQVIIQTERHQRLKATTLHLSGGKLFWRAYPFYQDCIVFHVGTNNLSDNATIWYCDKTSQLPAWSVKLSRDGRITKVLPSRLGVIKDSQGVALSCGDA